MLQINRDGWYEEMEAIGDYLAGYGDQAPVALEAEQRKIVASLA